MKTKIFTSAMIIALLLLASFSLALMAQIGRSLSYPLEPSLDGASIPKYVSELVIPPVYQLQPMWDPETASMVQSATVDMTEFYEQILPSGYPMTLVWGYGGQVKDAITGQSLGYVRNSPGPTFMATRNMPIKVNWVNHITRYFFPVDPTLHWANTTNYAGMVAAASVPDFPPGLLEAQAPVPLVTHLHGAEVSSLFDGHPEAWWTADGLTGPEYNTLSGNSYDSAVFYYPNEQPAATLWYHDHGLGVTRINVMSGLAGFYLLNEPGPLTGKLPSGKYDVPIVIQDRSFNEDGSMWFPVEGNSPDDHPYWNPEFFGDVIMVNGKTWPNFNVDQGQYRLRLLDGSNARFYHFNFSIVETPGDVPAYGDAIPFTVIGSDGGYLPSAVPGVTDLTIGPGERIEILIDFSTLEPGDKVIMTNDAIAPYKGPYVDVPDDAPSPATTGQIMQFTVTGNQGAKAKNLPATLNPTLPTYPTLGTPDANRTLPFFEAVNAELDEPVGVFLNGQKWSGVLTETPEVGSTEDWYLVNPTEDAHPIHTHLTQFQIMYRQQIDVDGYVDAWLGNNSLTEADIPMPIEQVPVEVPVDDYVIPDTVEYPSAYESGWKDTIHAWPGYVTVIRIRYAPIASPTSGMGAPSPGVNLYPFDPTTGPGYVWHCHILDHEDNEMMRPFKVVE